jgi:quercetin dioxygenase-like cupin family protein
VTVEIDRRAFLRTGCAGAMRTRFLAIPLSVLVQVTPGCVGQLPADPPAEASAGLDGAADPSIYFDFDDPDDPYRELYAEFRARRARDMSDPNKPPPVERYPAVHFTRGMSWSALEEVFPFDWPALRATSPDEASQLEASVRARLALDHPDLKIVQVMLGPDALLPTHADGAPGVLIVVGGRGEITVEGETQLAEPGTTVKLAPYDTRRVAAVGDTPFRLLWIRWAPDGDQAYIDAGYYLTGANQHNQPESADMPMDYSFWGAEYGVSPLHEPTLAVSPPVDGEHSGAAARGLAHARSALGEGRDLYPDVPRFGHESDREWLSVDTLKSGPHGPDRAPQGDLPRDPPRRRLGLQHLRNRLGAALHLRRAQPFDTRVLLCDGRPGDLWGGRGASSSRSRRHHPEQ